MSAARSRPLAVVVFFLLASAAFAWAQPPHGAKRPQPKLPAFPDTVIVESDVEYGKAGDLSLKLDIVRPKQSSEKPRPVIAEIHGGAWSGSTKESVLGGVIPFAASGNYIGVSIEYRLSGVAKWPAQIQDCKAAIRWLKANATKHNIGPSFGVQCRAM
jgi:acetyl esterase/lipase